MNPIILALFLFGAGLPVSTLAQTVPQLPPKPDSRIAQLEIALNHVNQEQQSVYQQFQMVQELRRNEVQGGDPLMVQGMGGIKDAPPINYDDNIRAQRERQELVEQYNRDLNRLYSRYSELGEQKKTLLDQIMDLAKETAR
ncbi:MAG: hypothetical protein H0X43_12705 [Nitrosospira sp.]|nr:hypothetical protein [Nitrosospira sp.]